MRSTLCHHKLSCPLNSLFSFIKVFLLAFGLKIGIFVAFIILRATKNKPQQVENNKDANSQKLKNDTGDAVRFGLFLGTLAFSFNAVQCLLRNIRKKEDGWNSFIAGGVSGLSLLIEHKQSRTDLSIYLFVQALSNLARIKMEKNGIRLWNFLDIVIFSIFGGIVQYSFVWEPDTMDHVVYNFLFTMTSKVDKQALKYLRELCYKKWPQKDKPKE